MDNFCISLLPDGAFTSIWNIPKNRPVIKYVCLDFVDENIKFCQHFPYQQCRDNDCPASNMKEFQSLPVSAGLRIVSLLNSKSL